eukprot:1422947-Pleurochrysis_carterae.AAC.1
MASEEATLAAALVAAHFVLHELIPSLENAPSLLTEATGPREDFSKQPRRGDKESDVLLERWRVNEDSSPWWLYYNNAKNPPAGDDGWWAQQFRNRFRVPVEIFETLCAETNGTEKWCDSMLGDGRRGPNRISLKLKMMGTLYIIGQGASTQMACDLNCCSYAVMSTFLHEWTAWLVEMQYPKHVRLPVFQKQQKRFNVSLVSCPSFQVF